MVDVSQAGSRILGAVRGQTRLHFLCARWNDIGTITHSKSTILVELVSKEETALFHMVSRTGGRAGPMDGVVLDVLSLFPLV